jgi:prephenate dehydrogenase
LVLDVGSAKQSISDVATRIGLTNFVGCHPLAGDHRAGWTASRVGLFGGATVYLCPHETSAAAAVALARELWLALGGSPVHQSPLEHDRLLAWTSHLPQVASSAVAVALAQAGHRPDRLGKGGRDVTRLAMSSAPLWTGIALENAAALQAAIASLRAELEAVEEALARGSREEVGLFFETAREWRGS